MISLDNLSPEDLLVLTNALTISFSKDKNINELNVVGNLLVSVGSLMLVIAAQQQLLSSLNENSTTPPNSSENKTDTSNDKN